MSTIIAVTNNGVYEGFDENPVKRCTPKILGFGACAELSASGTGTVTLRLTAETPVKNFTKTFSFNSDISFDFSPIKGVEITVSIKNFKVTNDTISFNLGLEGCFDIPVFGKKCKNASFSIELPMPIVAANNIDDLSSGDLALILLAAKEDACNC